MTSSVLDKEENILKESQEFGSKNLFVSKASRKKLRLA
jgi:hypothetical protein